MKRFHRGERGQALIEFAIVAILLFTITIGLLDVGLAFYQYNALSDAARVGARWAAVVGGTCVEQPPDLPVKDWCNQYGNATLAAGAPSPMTFWTERGNYPKQAAPAPCPVKYDTTFTGYYTASNYTGAGNTSIVGSIAQHFDSSSGGYFDQVLGSFGAGLNLSQLKVCIQQNAVSPTSGSWMWQEGIGTPVKVVVYYHFQPATGLLAKAAIDMVASSQYVSE